MAKKKDQTKLRKRPPHTLTKDHAARVAKAQKLREESLAKQNAPKTMEKSSVS